MAICLQSSLPMEPPPPVTSTRRPRISVRTSSELTTMGSRPKRSLISTSRSCLVEALFIIWLMPGSTCTLQPVAAASCVISFISAPEAEGMVM